MFDIGFLEIMVVLIIALLVIGPERMPEVARKIGQFVGKMRRFVQSVKEDSQMQDTINDFKNAVNLEEEQKQINQIGNELQSGLNFDADLKPEEFQRPFGGDVIEDNESRSSSQFNKAPAQPAIPKPEIKTEQASKPTMSAEQHAPAKAERAEQTTDTATKVN